LNRKKLLKYFYFNKTELDTS